MPADAKVGDELDVDGSHYLTGKEIADVASLPIHLFRDQVLRVQLKAAGIDDSWASLRATLSVQRRLTASLRRKDGRTVHVRKSTVAEPALMAIYRALAISAAPGGSKKLIS